MHGFHHPGGHSTTPVICRTACRNGLEFTSGMGSAVRAVCGSEAKGILGFSRGVDLAPSISWSAKDSITLEFSTNMVSSFADRSCEGQAQAGSRNSVFPWALPLRYSDGSRRTPSRWVSFRFWFSATRMSRGGNALVRRNRGRRPSIYDLSIYDLSIYDLSIFDLGLQGPSNLGLLVLRPSAFSGPKVYALRRHTGVEIPRSVIRRPPLRPHPKHGSVVVGCWNLALVRW